MTRTVLVFDSSSVTCHTVSKQLRMVGYDTLQARSLADARLALAAKPVDLIILGLASLDTSAGGIALLRELRRIPACQKTPVIVLTASARDGDRMEARAAGAVAFLTKPVSTRELLVTVNNALALHAPVAQASPSRTAQSDALPAILPRRDWRPEWVGAAVASMR